MSNNLKLFSLEFGSLLTYSPKGLDSGKKSKSVMRALKDDIFVSNPPILTSEFISNILKERKTSLPFAHFFETKPILVPIPNSSLTREGTLWVPQRLANALHKNGLGVAVVDILRRIVPLRKAATSLSKERPTALQHFNSLEVQKVLSSPKEILLVDDIVTRGATLLGAANRLKEVFPRVHIQAFAAMRTISPPDPFKDIIDPCIGEITLSGQDTYRRP